jgi:hypothetical protein
MTAIFVSLDIQAAHEADDQEEVAFHEAIKELHARVIAKRNATEHLRQVVIPDPI